MEQRHISALALEWIEDDFKTSFCRIKTPNTMNTALNNIRQTMILGRMGWQVLLAKITHKPKPVSTNLQVTKVCNLDCPYCFADLHSLTKVTDPSTKDLF